MDNQEYKYELEFEVRDYEVDLQGIVNNAVYHHYLEHTRHKYMLTLDIDFAKLHDEGINPVVHRVEIDYKGSLTSGDIFVVKLGVHKEGRIKFIFTEDIFKLPNNEPIIKSKIQTLFTKNGRPIAPPIDIQDKLEGNIT